MITVRRVLNRLHDAGFSGAAFLSVAILDAAHARMMTADWRRGAMAKPPLLGSDVYKTELYQVPIGADEIIADLEPTLSEVWCEFGQSDGTPSIEDGTWAYGDVRFQTDTVLEEGDR